MPRRKTLRKRIRDLAQKYATDIELMESTVEQSFDRLIRKAIGLDQYGNVLDTELDKVWGTLSKSAIDFVLNKLDVGKEVDTFWSRKEEEVRRMLHYMIEREIEGKLPCLIWDRLAKRVEVLVDEELEMFMKRETEEEKTCSKV